MTEIKEIASQVRRDIVRMVHGAKSGHPGGSLGCTDLLTILYFKMMHFETKSFNIDGVNEDLFFLSNGHISPLFYSILARSGYFPISELANFRKINSRLQGHPTNHDHLPGVRISSGSLGQGLSVAIGAALAKKFNNDNKFVYVLMGDGELQEGQIWEAALFAAHYKLSNLIAFVDVNGQQIDGPTQKVINLGNLEAKFNAFGWRTMHMDGHDYDHILATIQQAQNPHQDNLPTIILMKTIMGKGVSFMEGTHEWHGIAPNDQQLSIALNELQETLGDYKN